MFSLNSVRLEILFLFDWISLLFIRFVLFISSIVLIYRIEYMGGDKNISRFLFLVIMFVISIMFMIISPNLVSILLGWDGLGLVSYCLVIYYQSFKSYSAGILTALRNRVGDVALLIGLRWIFYYGSYNFMFYTELFNNDIVIKLTTFLVVLAAFTKRAQIPFSAWLPAAIAAPTPVSSLVHSSTLVTAGVYLLIRFNKSLNSRLILFVLLIRVLTIFISGLGANLEFDLKKIIALSTLRQLGLIIRVLLLGRFKLAFYHLLIHALFKALLFICAGSFIHSFSDNQDIRFMGNMYIYIPVTRAIFIVANFSLCGIPFLSGFYSKDLILEFSSISRMSVYFYLIFYISTGLTVSYRVRLRYYLFFSKINFLSYFRIGDYRILILKSKLALVMIRILIGCCLNWLIIDTPYFIYLSYLIKIITLLIVGLGSWLGYEVSFLRINYTNKRLKFYFIRYFASMWNLPILSTVGLNYYPLSYGKIRYRVMDQGWYEMFGGLYIKRVLFYYVSEIEKFSRKKLKIILFILVFFLLFYIIYLNSLIRA